MVNTGKSGPLPLSWRNPRSLIEWLVALIQKVENNCIRIYCYTYFILWINVIVIFYIMKWLGTNASLCRSGYYLILKWKISFLEFIIISLHYASLPKAIWLIYLQNFIQLMFTFYCTIGWTLKIYLFSFPLIELGIIFVYNTSDIIFIWLLKVV